ncbi:acid protease [Pholiota conissans]|uniref:Acid protease n=1 Tax=Pholiota conissans TaxID=109636 RepID=A0A9P5Z970_9AGAR|nr:acid protease [Pholiota conissans]
MSIATLTLAYAFIAIVLFPFTGAYDRQIANEGTTSPHVQHEVSVTTIGAPKYNNFKSRGSRGIVGIGKHLDHLFTIPITVGDQVFSVNLDTGSSDLWLISENCQTNACKESNVPRYSASAFSAADVDVEMQYGDSKTGTFAQGTIGFDTATISNISMVHQPFALIDDTSNLIVQFGATGIFGLGFPTASSVQGSILGTTIDSATDIDNYVDSMGSHGPLISRIAMAGALDAPMFSLSLQRDERDPTRTEKTGFLTLGKLPHGIDNSSLTWVPVRLYAVEDGGMGPPSFAADEVYPYRWEIDIEGVFLDGERLPETTIPANGVDSKRVSALIDTGNSLIRGPEDVVVNLLQTISPGFNPSVEGSVPAVPCNVPRTLEFQIGGQMFPIDPRDFISQLDLENAIDCQADNLVPADPSAYGALFRWSLGTPFFKSNFVAFHYGNLTHPSVDPPRIGFLSRVPSNAGVLLQNAVRDAMQYMVDVNNGVDNIDPPNVAHTTAQTNTILGDMLDSRVAANHSSTLYASNYLPVLIHVAILISFYI